MRYSISQIKEKYYHNLPIITVYGSSTAQPDSELYNQAIQVGKTLSNNFVVASGGYTGIMDGISKGVSETGGTVIGITTDDITRVKPSQFLTEEYREQTLMTRLQLMQGIANAHLFMPGSTGTLTELSLIWDKQKLGLLPVAPILLLGKVWHRIFSIIFEENDEVPLSPWKLDQEVKNNTMIINSVQDLKKWAKKYRES